MLRRSLLKLAGLAGLGALSGGAALVTPCPACRAPNVHLARFCRACGTRLGRSNRIVVPRVCGPVVDTGPPFPGYVSLVLVSADGSRRVRIEDARVIGLTFEQGAEMVDVGRNPLGQPVFMPGLAQPQRISIDLLALPDNRMVRHLIGCVR